jgi:hypothetical protein
MYCARPDLIGWRRPLDVPLLAFYRSQHVNQKWLAALTAIVDAAFIRATVPDKAPAEGDHPDRQRDQHEQQAAEHRPVSGAAERLHGLQARADERVDREQDDQRENRHARPGDGNDPDDDAENAKQDQ